MLYLEGMTIHNFKSFRHSSIKFSKGFNCIVGHNGSGKSNIWDALLFALGETSLRRLRVDRAEKLISAGAKSKKGLCRAYVTLYFNGDRKLEVTRAINSDLKIGYRIDGKRTTRQEVIDALKSYRCFADDTNTIAQGEIVYMEKLTSKQRRELIDSAAGIKEFDEKRGASIKELEKVDEKIREAQIELDMRRGFLSDIEKQKADAESYIKLKDYVTRGAFTILKAKEQQVAQEYEGGDSAIKAIEAKAAEITSRLLSLESEESSLSKERAELTGKLNEKSIEATRISGMLNEVEKQIAIKNSEAKSLHSRIEERDAELAGLINDRENASKSATESSAFVDRINAEIAAKSGAFGDRKLEKLLSSGKEATAELLAAYERNQAQIRKLQSDASSLSSRLASIDAELAQCERLISQNRELAKSKSINLAQTEAELSNAEKGLAIIVKERTSLAGISAQSSQKLSEITSRIGTLDGDEFKVKEQIAMSGGTAERRMTELLKSQVKGLHGRAYELCSYDEAYSDAVTSASSARLSYFIVDSEAVAEKAIRLIKEKKMGRASFIPLNRIVEQKRPEQGMDPLISHVSYDPKFEKAFAFIFSDTYMVDSIAAASRPGMGRHRYVTLEGELIEQSGVITGGALSLRASLPALEAKLAGILKERLALQKERSKLEEEAASSARKLSELGAQEHELAFIKRQKSESAALLKTEIKSAESEIARLSEAERELNVSKASSAAESERILASISALESENGRLSALSKRGAAESERMKEVERYNAARAEIESLKASLAEKRKEAELSSKRVAETDIKIETARKQLNESRAALSAVESALSEMKRSHSELQEEYKSHGSKHGGIMSKLEQVNAKLSKITEERGRRSAELSRHEREAAESKVRMSQQKIRLSDIRADLAAYGATDQISDEPIDVIEKKVASAKSQMERLGGVNLKAPEIYAQKKTEVDEAVGKMDVLQKEKGSVMSVINEIDARKLSVFMQTFNEVNEKFKQLHGYIFDGDASLELEDKKDPLASGINIVVNEGRNRNMLHDQLSGGEKSLKYLMLLFSIQMRNPMAFYLFDEVDISLDKENTKKLSKLVSELSKQSQMIVVSHKDDMLSSAQTTLGVVRRDDESQVVGISLDQVSAAAKDGA